MESHTFQNVISNSFKDVVKFISHFKGAEDTFLNGCCYWFAWILRERFHERGFWVDIFYDPIEGHFVARFITDCDDITQSEIRLFDIRGDVTDLYREIELENLWVMSMNEERRYGKLMCDCREFIQPEDYPSWIKNQFAEV